MHDNNHTDFNRTHELNLFFSTQQITSLLNNLKQAAGRSACGSADINSGPVESMLWWGVSGMMNMSLAAVESVDERTMNSSKQRNITNMKREI